MRHSDLPMDLQLVPSMIRQDLTHARRIIMIAVNREDRDGDIDIGVFVVDVIELT